MTTTKAFLLCLLSLLAPPIAFSFTPSSHYTDRLSTSRLLGSVDAATRTRTLPPVEIVDGMPEDLPLTLRNKYYLLRHGQSTANVQGIISSNRHELAYTDKHGLTDTGYQQGKAAAQQLVDLMDDDPSSVVFVSSPFARARQTAQACIDGLVEREVTVSNPDIQLHDGLMERCLDRKSTL